MFYIAINGILVVCFILFVGYLCTLKDAPLIAINGKNGLLRQPSEYQQSFNTILRSSIFNKSKFTINTSNLSRAIQERHPEIGSATVVIPFFSRQPKVVITSIKPAFILNSKNDSYIIDEYGVAVARVQDVQNIAGLDLVTITDEAGIQIEQGKPVLSQEQTNFIREVISQLSLAGKKVITISIPVSAYDIKVQLRDVKYYVKMNMQGDARAQAGKYIATEKELSQTKKTPTEYIDVRVDERVYIK